MGVAEAVIGNSWESMGDLLDAVEETQPVSAQPIAATQTNRSGVSIDAGRYRFTGRPVVAEMEPSAETTFGGLARKPERFA
jgi:hypothetical protein